MTQTYIVKNKRGPNISKSNSGARYWHITFKGSDDGLTYETYVDTTMENFPQWDTILAAKDQVIVSGLKLKNKKLRLITADSQPKIVGVVPKYIPEPELPKGSTFHNLFE